MSNEVHLEIDHKADEHVRAERLYYSRRSKFARVDKLVALLLVVIGIVAVITVGVRWWSVIWFVLAPLEFFNLLSIAPLVTKYRFSRTPKFRELNHITFRDDGIHFRTTSIDSKLEWSFYDGVLEDEQLFLLAYGGQMYSVIPKRCFRDPASLATFRSLIESKIIHRASSKESPATAAR